MDQQFQSFLQDFHWGVTTDVPAFLGCHRQSRGGRDGFVFRVWAPNAKSISVVGEFNFWNGSDLPMVKYPWGVWECWSGYAKEGDAYKYLVEDHNGGTIYKSDPVGFRVCRAPDTSSVICDLSGFVWHDGGYLAAQGSRMVKDSPVNIYELHLASWRRREDGSLYSYTELAPMIAGYAKNMGYTHVELMPLAEYPYDPSWGYQVTGFYAPTSRFGSPKEFMMLVDTLHRAGVGVIVDWVPGYFPKDASALYQFDGTCTYESADPERNEDVYRGTRLFDYSKPEVRNFLLSNAAFWLRQYHLDGIRVSGVDAMLHPGAMPPEQTDPHALAFLRELERVCRVQQQAILITEGEDLPSDADAGLHWSADWTQQALALCCGGRTPEGDLTPREDAPIRLLPLSHDEVVQGKGSLVSKMPGEYDRKFDALRLLLSFQMACPGKKLLFMGGEFAQFIEWDAGQGLDWMLLGFDRHRQMQAFVRDLNHLYRREPALWRDDAGAMEWICRDKGVLALRRTGRQGEELIFLMNFSDQPLQDLRLGLPGLGRCRCILSSDDPKYGGSGGCIPPVPAKNEPAGEYNNSGDFHIGPMSAAFYQWQPESPAE